MRLTSMPPLAGPARRSATARAGWLALWLVLCLAPWLGRMHQVLHAPAPAPTAAHAPVGGAHALPGGHDLWHHTQGSDCLLWDHLALADALCSTVPPLASPPVAPLAAEPPWASVLPAPWRGFEARAPPTA